ncbi:protein translocase SEC61 complex gamma subunit, archaeal and eukaryotic [Cryptococcus sp. DSM 104549]
MSERLTEFADVPRQFVKEGTLFVNRCTKPSKAEYIQLCRAVAVGFAVMGFIGYFVKLIHIPINNILVYVQLYNFVTGAFNWRR